MRFTCQAAEKAIDRSSFAARFTEPGRIQMGIGHQDHAVRRDHIDVVGLHLGFLRHLDGRHGCEFLQQLRHVALMFGVQMGDDNEGHPGVRG